MKKFKIIIALIIGVQLSTYAQGLLTNLQACYPLDSNVTNYAPPGSILDGSPVGVSPTTGHNTSSPNTAYAFGNSTSSYIQLPSHRRIKPDTISFSAWVMFNNVGTRQYIVFAKNSCFYYFEGYNLNAEPHNGDYVLQLVKSSSACSPATEQVIFGTTDLVADHWYHIGFYMGNDYLKVYVDGQLETSAASYVNFDYDDTDVFLGGTNQSHFNMPLDGALDNVRFYNRMLTDQEFDILYRFDPSCEDSWCRDPKDPDCREYIEGKPANVVGLNSIKSSSTKAELYPNPSAGKIYLRNGQNTSLVVYDATGKIVEYTVTVIDEKTSEINLSNKAEGVFLVRMFNAEGNLVKSTKMVVNH